MASTHLGTKIVDSLLPSAGALAGFALAWILFELTEWRKRIIQRNAIRQALRAELRNAEGLLNQLVTRYAVGVGDKETAVKELRWLLTEGWSSRGRLSEMTTEQQRNLVSKSDEELWDFLSRSGWKLRTVEVPIPLPIVQAVLSSPIAGLSAVEIERLAALNWQSHLLGTQARWMEHYQDLTFTDLGENYETVVINLKGAQEWYGKRAGYMLKYVHDIVTSLDAPINPLRNLRVSADAFGRQFRARSNL